MKALAFSVPVGKAAPLVAILCSLSFVLATPIMAQQRPHEPDEPLAEAEAVGEIPAGPLQNSEIEAPGKGLEVKPPQPPVTPLTKPSTLPASPTLPAPLTPQLPTASSPDATATPQKGITAMEALRRLTERFGVDAVAKIIEMKGPNGQNQPESWTVAAVDLSSPFLAKTFAVHPTRVVDEGENRSFYPDHPPAGFVSTAKLEVGSYDAFIALDKAASEAKVGFDAVHYRLRAREGSNEPIWTMTAIDSDRFAVGLVDVSGTTGKVLRTVWLRRAGVRSLPTVEDSALKKALRN